MNPIVYGVYNIRKKIDRNNMVKSNYSIRYYSHDFTSAVTPLTQITQKKKVVF